jgi:hypothetical protein
MKPWAGATVVALGSALTGCIDPETWSSEPTPYYVYQPAPVYGLQLGCIDCRGAYVHRQHHHHHGHTAHHDPGKRHDGKHKRDKK